MIRSFLSMSMSWYVVFGVFLMTVQLGQSAHQRDIVDHAASVAADTLTKTLCADARDYGGTPLGTYAGERARAVKAAVDPLLALAAPKDACRIDVRPNAEAASADPAARPMELAITCTIPCSVPFAAQAMCEGWPGHVTFQAKQTAVAMGCDAGETE